MRSKVSRAALYVILASMIASPASGQRSTAPADLAALQGRLQAKLDSLHKGASFAGATVGIALPDGRVIALATGMSDTARKLAMRSTDRLMQGSVGKTYVAAVALQLVHEGKLDLDAKIECYLGDAPWFARLPNAGNITVRQLMNHTSGLVRYEFQDAFTRDLTASPDKSWRPEELVAYVLGSAPPFAAGAGWEYSDTNYIVLGMILEHVTGRAYFTLLRERLLTPLGLANTVPVEGRVVPGLVQGYAGAANPFGGGDAMIVDGRFTINPQFEWTGGGIASTAGDLARWATLMYGGKAFDPSLIPTMTAAVPARLGPNTKYGLGVIIRQTPLGESWGHSGFFPGYQTEMMYWPERRFAVAFQVNSSAPGTVGRSPARVVMELGQVVADAFEDSRR